MTPDERERETDPIGAEPFPLPLPLDDLRTPVPPQDLAVILAELTTQVRNWHDIGNDERVPEDVRSVYHRCADAIARLLTEHSPTYISDLAPESGR